MSKSDPAYAKYIASNLDPIDVGSLERIWQNLFVKYFLRNNDRDNSIFIVLDGMDEADRDSREDFLGLLKDVDVPDSRIRFLMLGRPQITENLEFAQLDLPTIHVNKNNNSDDIVKYIRCCINKSPFLKRQASKALREEVIEKLSEGAQGMVNASLSHSCRVNDEVIQADMV
jgi:hypothetical protein